jgi:signal transduction histidine kinase
MHSLLTVEVTVAGTKSEFTLDASIPTASLESILCTEELQRRPSRPADYEKENYALVKLMGALADSPSTIFQRLAETILEITQCDSAGLSLLTKDGKTPHVDGQRFYWPAICGMWNPHVGGGTPRNFGPCGDVLDQNRTLLFTHFERRYPYLIPVDPAAEECLLVPFYVADKAVGTIWGIMHNDLRKFDAEDDRVMASLGKFASSAYQAWMHIEGLKIEIAEREKVEAELLKLTDGLEAQVRARTEELRRSEAFLVEGQRLGQIGSYSWRVATGKITWSEQLYHIYELETGVPVTLELIRARVHPDDLILFDKMVEQASSGGKDFEWQYRLIMPDHSIKYLQAVARATRDRVGQLEYIAAIQDVTARRLSEEARDKARLELAHVARMMSLGTLAASIAHEISQPLSGIVTNASTCQRMLAATPPNIDGALETARRTIRDANRASEVITRLRALFSRKQTATESVDLNEATREVIALSLSELQNNRILVQHDFAENLPAVKGDRIQLQQVILNLLRNASDAMRDVDNRPRQLLIKTESDGSKNVQLTVRDTGVGFAPDDADQLFESFYTTKRDGIGIGLSVSRTIIEAHRGHLWAAQNDGPGSSFFFSIPSDQGSQLSQGQ